MVTVPMFSPIEQASANFGVALSRYRVRKISETWALADPDGARIRSRMASASISPVCSATVDSPAIEIVSSRLLDFHRDLHNFLLKLPIYLVGAFDADH